jgi:protein-tyrosine-phosphatase
MIQRYDLIVVMDANQRRDIQRFQGGSGRTVILGDFDPEPIQTRAILDPWKQAEEAFTLSYSRIDRCLAELGRAVISPNLETPARKPIQRPDSTHERTAF